ncbi:MAG: zinc-ribbon and DUF3426 domain-containing protein [Gammaproteobacteria bacterium]|nr:zinc-ribbon and DUF3426 domain-containing protein [Gammaproteobacteria bacterium]
MYTVCPKCTLTLAVTAADLRAGQGYVRCGRCANVFNALLALFEDSGLALADTQPRDRQQPVAEDRASATVSRPALTEGDVASASAPALRLVDSPPRPLPPADTPEDELEIKEYRGTGTFETIVLEGDTFLQTEELIPQEVLDSELAEVTRRVAAAVDEGDDDGAAVVEVDLDDGPQARIAGDATQAAARAGDDALPRELAALREATGEFRHEANLTATGIEADLWRAPKRARHRTLFAAGSALLLVSLAAQAVNHWRNDLAANASWYGPLQKLAARLGEPLAPNWDLNAYDVRQLGAALDAAGDHALHVRLSLANRGAHSQALPLLRLTLLDRYGKPVSSGELQPAQYLPAALRGQQFIARDQRIDTEVRVEDPTQRIASFELDVCVAAAGGGVRCAGDAPLVAGRP